jgi:predicted methyltransferase
MNRTVRILSSSALAVSLLVGAASFAGEAPANVKAAVANSARPEADTARDANRKPAEVIAFAGIKAGDKVADIAPGGGYFTRIFSKVVGPSGKVYGVVGAAQLAAKPASGDAIRALQADASYGNVVLHPADFDKLTLPEPVDVVWTSLNYHDFMSREGFTAAMNKAVFAALKPGGTYIVIDHSAEKGSGARDIGTLHRVDAERVKQEVLAAGFKLEAESGLLANSADTRTTKVFEADTRGKTDQFVLKFKKP